MSTHELDLFDHVAYTAASMSKELFTEPDDDWTPIVFMEDADGERITMPIEQFMIDDDTKDVLADLILPGVIQKIHPTTLVMVLSAWQSTIPVGVDLMDRPRPSEDLNREEILVVTEYTSEGVARAASAKIIRHSDSPPTLGEWEDWSNAITSEGRFVEPIVAAMKRI